MEMLEKRINGKLQCLLCPHNCIIGEGKTGICRVRKNTGERIDLLTYGVLSGCSLDPVEKKPLYHFYPGYRILSAGSYGCNMRCDFCQNYNISQHTPEKLNREIMPGNLAREAQSYERNIGLAFTYNEPVIWFEYMRDTALAVKEAGLYTVMVSNGFVNSGPLEEITGFIDAFNIDLKAFNDRFYRKLTGTDIEPVKNGLKQIAASGRHLEITTLIIPGQNDSDEEMEAEAEWIAGELGKDVPLHLSRYYPMNRRNDPPTPIAVMERLHMIASGKLNYVYIGNIESESGQNTCCPRCMTIITERTGYRTIHRHLDDKGRCGNCGLQIYRYFSLTSWKDR